MTLRDDSCGAAAGEHQLIDDDIDALSGYRNASCFSHCPVFYGGPRDFISASVGSLESLRWYLHISYNEWSDSFLPLESFLYMTLIPSKLRLPVELCVNKLHATQRLKIN